MPIQLSREVENSGFTANYWRLDVLVVTRGKVGVNDVLAGTFNLYKSAADFDTKRQVESVGVSIVGNVVGATTATQMITALENAAIAEGGPLEGGEII
jgi:hypothetical protein